MVFDEVIRHEGEKWVLYTADGKKQLGEFESEEAAKKREREIQFFKHQKESAQAKGLLKEGELLPGAKAAFFTEDAQALIDSFGSWAGGSHTKCVEALEGKEGISDAARLCAWLKDQYTGTTDWRGKGESAGLTVGDKLREAIARKQVRSRLQEMSLGGVSVSEYETKLRTALEAKLGAGLSIQDVYEGLVVFEDKDMAAWGAPYKIDAEGAVAVGKPIRVRRTCRYIPDEVAPEKPPIEDRGDQGDQSLIPGDWWKDPKYWGDGNKALGGGAPTDGGQSRGQESLREEVVLVESTFLEASAGAIAPVKFRDDGTVPVCIIQPGQGSSAYYEREQLKRDAGIFKGCLSFFDHQTLAEERERPEGSIKDVAGKVLESYWTDTGFKGPGVYGDLYVIPPHREFVASVAPLTGLSIRAAGKTVRKEMESRRTPTAERFTVGRSVDLVTAAGAGGQVGTLTESARPQVEEYVGRYAADHKIAENDTGLQEFIEWARAAETTAPQEENMAEKEQIATLEAEVTRLKDDNKRLTEGLLLVEVAKTVDAALAQEKDLPEVTRTRLAEVLKRETPLKEGKLDTEALTAKVGATVKEEKAYLAKVAPGGIKGMGAAADDATAGKTRLREARIAMYRGQGKSKEQAEKLADAGAM